MIFGDQATDNTEACALGDYAADTLPYCSGTTCEPGGYEEHTEPQSAELIPYPEYRPPFLRDAPEGSFSHQIDIVLPITDPRHSLVVAADKGSDALSRLHREMENERAVRESVDVSRSHLAAILSRHMGVKIVDEKPSDQGALEEEVEHLQRKLRRLEDRSRPQAGRSPEELADHRNEAELAHVLKESKRQSILSASFSASDPHRLEIARTRRSLPIFEHRQALLRTIGENHVCIIRGETGSGKTTQIAQYLYEEGYAKNGKLIGCTQPRRLAAIAVASRVAQEVGCVLGTIVGYSIRMDDTTTEQTRIKFMTDGLLLREILHDPNVDKYSVIILDEAHERTVDTDILLGVMKAVLRRRSDFKLIVTSATMDVQKFSDFFDSAPRFDIPGRMFPVEVKYQAALVEDYVSEAVLRVHELHVQCTLESSKKIRQHSVVRESADLKSDQVHSSEYALHVEPGGDILVFMTGRDDVYGTCELLRRQIDSMGPKWKGTLLIVPCLGEVSPNAATQAQILDPPPPGVRKCVVATNVAETSLTIDGIRFVIDCGFMKTNVFRPRIGMNTLKRYPVSQAQANQRKGRAGRTAAGVCFRLYTEPQFNYEMLPSAVPEIQRSSIDSLVLFLKSIGVENLLEFDFIDPPPEANLRAAMRHLYLLGALDDEGKITTEGRLMLEFPLAPTLAKMVVDSARVYGCSKEIIDIVSIISADCKSLFETPKGKEEEARSVHSRFHVVDSDHLTLMHVLRQFTANGSSRRWAHDHFLNYNVLRRAQDVRTQLVDHLHRSQLTLSSSGPGNNDPVRQCIAGSFTLQSARRCAGKWTEYQNLLAPGVLCHIHPTSAIVSRSKMPEYVVYNDFLQTTKEYILNITAVEPQWLAANSRGMLRIRGEEGPCPPLRSTSTSTANHSSGRSSREARPSISTAPPKFSSKRRPNA